MAPLKYPWSGRGLLQSRLRLREHRGGDEACAPTPVAFSLCSVKSLKILALPITTTPLPSPQELLRQRAERVAALALRTFPTRLLPPPITYSTNLPRHNTTNPSHPTSPILLHLPKPTFLSAHCALRINTTILPNFAAHPPLRLPPLAKPIAVLRWPSAPHIASLQIALGEAHSRSRLSHKHHPHPHNVP